MPPCNSGERPLYSVARPATVPNNPSSGKRLESCGTTSPLLQVGVVDEVPAAHLSGFAKAPWMPPTILSAIFPFSAVKCPLVLLPPTLLYILYDIHYQIAIRSISKTASFGCLDSDYLPPMPGSGWGGFSKTKLLIRVLSY